MYLIYFGKIDFHILRYNWNILHILKKSIFLVKPFDVGISVDCNISNIGRKYHSMDIKCKVGLYCVYLYTLYSIAINASTHLNWFRNIGDKFIKKFHNLAHFNYVVCLDFGCVRCVSRIAAFRDSSILQGSNSNWIYFISFLGSILQHLLNFMILSMRYFITDHPENQVKF